MDVNLILKKMMERLLQNQPKSRKQKLSNATDDVSSKKSNFLNPHYHAKTQRKVMSDFSGKIVAIFTPFFCWQKIIFLFFQVFKFYEKISKFFSMNSGVKNFENFLLLNKLQNNSRFFRKIRKNEKKKNLFCKKRKNVSRGGESRQLF